jgi:hypothetical protein
VLSQPRDIDRIRRPELLEAGVGDDRCLELPYRLVGRGEDECSRPYVPEKHKLFLRDDAQTVDDERGVGDEPGQPLGH